MNRTPSEPSAHCRTARVLPRTVRLSLLFLLVSIGFVLWRGSSFIVWDDTSSASFNKYSNGLHYSWSAPSFFHSLLRDAFGNLGGDGYRPLSKIMRGIGSAWFSRDRLEPLPFVAVTGLLLGFWAVGLWTFSRRFTQSHVGADLVVFLNLASVPVLTSTLIISSGSQIVVTLLICTGLLLHANARESRHRRVWYIPMSALLLVGPWFREFVGVTAILVLAAEFLCLFGRPQFAPVAIGIVGLAHAAFPTALVHATAFPDLPVLPVHQLGNLAQALQGEPAAPGVLAGLQSLHWRIFGDLFAILPPSLFVIACAGILWRLVKREASLPNQPGLFLLAFFGLTFLPFLKVFHEQVHLAYSLAPMGVLLAMALERLWLHCGARVFMRPALGVALLVPLGDHALNLYSVRHMTRTIYAAIRAQADWFSTNTPHGTVVIGNALHMEDIRYYSGGHIYPLSSAGGAPDPRMCVTDCALLERALKGREVPIYCLDARIPDDEGQRGASRRNWVSDGGALKTSFVRHDRLSCKFPFFDPLRMALPTRNLCWPGPPDLEFDFYRGRARESKTFEFEVALDYRLFLVNDRTVIKYMPHPMLLAEHVGPFNFIGHKNRIIAIPAGEAVALSPHDASTGESH